MLPTRLIKPNLLTKAHDPLAKRCTARRMLSNCRIKEAKEDDDEDNQPIKYSTSKAATWTAKKSRDMRPEYWPKYQSDVISLSLFAFLVYFCILREENDLDLIIDRELSYLVPDMAKLPPPQSDIVRAKDI